MLHKSSSDTPPMLFMWCDLYAACRYVGDGRDFWRYIVAQSTGCADERLAEELYDYYLQVRGLHGSLPWLAWLTCEACMGTSEVPRY